MVNKFKIFSAALFVSLLYGGILTMFFSYSPYTSAMSSAKESVSLPIIMYHSVLKDTDLSGKYVITPDALENDILYLRENGYTFVSAEELIDFTDNNGELPDKPVMLTFDDGFYNNLGYVKPILEKRGAKAVISVVGSYTDEYSESNIANMTYGYLRWSDVYDMLLSSRIEIGNHSYDFHSNTNGRNGSKKNKSESLEEYKRIFYEDTKKSSGPFFNQNRIFTRYIHIPVRRVQRGNNRYFKGNGFPRQLYLQRGHKQYFPRRRFPFSA